MGIIKLKNGDSEFVGDQADALRVIEGHLGFEMSQSVDELFTADDDPIGCDCESYQHSLEDNQSSFLEIKSIAGKLIDILSKSRVNKSRAIEEVERIIKECDDSL